ncbi:MAG TPA: cytochrome C oxidase subunit IV family protein [Bryobacteraceae bacterium]|nr:cytochrome C oxidase subunit IV family protein [Bryobacteraceae bacterium]
MSTEIANMHGEAGSRLYVWVWIYLLALTALEVGLAYVHVFSTTAMLVVLMVLSIVKAGLIVAYFMHMRSEKMTFVLSLMPSVVLVVSLLFAFFPDSFRLFELRVQ